AARDACARPIVLYTSVDEPIARPIVQAFTKKSGIEVKIVTDTEATKSIGLAERLRAEKGKPRCDVWWGNEPFHTVNLADEGLFEPYESANAKDVRGLFKDKLHRWTGCGIRARAIALSTESSILPSRLDDLLKPAFKNRVVMGKSAIGTIGGHVAAIYATRGRAKADDFFRKLRDNGVTLVGGNSMVVQQIASGNFAIGITDNDDIAALDPRQVSMILPDQAAGEVGTLAIPTTIALVKRDDASPESRLLIDFLVSADTEKMLIDAKFAGWSVRSEETAFRAMQIDYAEVAKAMPQAVRRAADILEGRDPHPSP
ncbi:MAG: extracellular solute-binding protein, partial [Burkholderiales bacterium]|nr:extracellular solute-binding protein [Phycisphaerae bacterium]